MKTTRVLIHVLILTCVHDICTAQQWKETGSDELFHIARKEVFEGNRSDGQEKLRYLIETSPNYADIKIFLARTYSWDGAYDDARILLKDVLQRDPLNVEALDAFIDLEIWSENYSEALQQIQSALQSYPGNTTFLYKRARALCSVGKPQEALGALDLLLQIDPTNEKALSLRNSIKGANAKYTIATSAGIDFFSRTFEPAQYAAVQAGRKNKWGSAILRINHSHRFNKDGFQFETDLYPAIMKGVYAYLNYGFSRSSLFPEHRLGADLYTSLPKSLEASAGMRYMYFDSDTKVIIYTGSVGWYFKDFWISLRSFLTPDRESGTSVSGTLVIRRYFKNAENFLGVSMGMGFSPDIRTIQSNAGLSESEIYVLQSQRAGLTWQHGFSERWSIAVSLDVARQELSFDQNSYVLITSPFVTLRKKI